MLPRRQPRIKGILPVRICGIDLRGLAFSERSCTATISFAGASLLGVRVPLSRGAIIDLQYRTRQAPFRVVWTVPASGGLERHIGLECLKPEKDFWPVTLPSQVHDPAAVDQLYYSRNGRRSDRRFAVAVGTAYVSRVGTDGKAPTRVGNISLSGCYLETNRPDFTGHRLELWIRVGQFELQALGVVRVRYPRTAMGIEFTFLSNAHMRTLERLIASLRESETLEQGATHQRPMQRARLTPKHP